MNPGELEGRVALVTGAARGIGVGICDELVRAGAQLVFNDLALDEAATGRLQELRATGADVEFVAGDVSEVATVRRLVDLTVKRFGRIDLLVSNAGNSTYRTLDEMTEEAWDYTLAVHVKGAFFAVQAAVPHMRRQGAGRVVIIGSEQAYIGYELLLDYTAAKGALLALNRSLARALAPAINVNLVAPGPTETPSLREGPEYTDEVREQILLKRWGTPHDIGRTVVFLAGPGGDFYTGQHLDPNGGTVMP